MNLMIKMSLIGWNATKFVMKIGYYWCLKGDEPWNMRVENDWFKEGWIICNDKKKRKKYN